MYVVVEFNQAGGWPQLADDSIHMNVEDADRMFADACEWCKVACVPADTPLFDLPEGS